MMKYRSTTIGKKIMKFTELNCIVHPDLPDARIQFICERRIDTPMAHAWGDNHGFGRRPKPWKYRTIRVAV
jgi:hypothetical protein